MAKSDRPGFNREKKKGITPFLSPQSYHHEINRGGENILLFFLPKYTNMYILDKEMKKRKEFPY
jgi:hypothetical protein